MGLIKKIKNIIRNFGINKQISKYRYVHVMFNEKFNKSFVDFLNSNFDINEHVILCKRTTAKYPFPEGDNVIEIKTLKGLRFDKNDKIICHSLFDRELVNYLYKHPKILKEKAYWVMWGGDLYQAPRDKKNDFVRSNFKGYLNDIDEDYARQKYNILPNKNFYGIFQDFPIKKQMLDNAPKESKNYIQIQINNSCDKSTLEILDVLSKFKNENVKITTILSYGQMEFKDEIIKKGEEIFGNKFEFVEKYMSPQDYANHLVQNDILVLNQDRQQGLGNTIASLYSGAKVFIKESISVNKYFNKKGIKIHNTDTIGNLTFEDFTKYEYIETTKKESGKYLDKEFLIEGWKEVFNAE